MKSSEENVQKFLRKMHENRHFEPQNDPKPPNFKENDRNRKMSSWDGRRCKMHLHDPNFSKF